MDFELACFQMFVGSARKMRKRLQSHLYVQHHYKKMLMSSSMKLKPWQEYIIETYCNSRVVVFLETNSLCTVENNLADVLLGNTLTYKIKNKK
jgi:hypothetical protein